MSLINDALKRAKQAQQQGVSPASPGPQLRPVEPTHPARQGIGLLLPFGLALVALFALFLFWRLSAKDVSARSAQSQPLPAVQQEAGFPSATVPPSVPPTTAPLSATEAASDPAPTPPPVVSSASAEPANIASNSPTTPHFVASPTAQPNSTAIPAETPPPKPAPLKLQAVVMHPTRPSAMVSGRPLFVGDRLGEFQVRAISQESITLVSGDKTNVLTLFQ